MGELYTMLKLADKCVKAGHDCVRMGNRDVEKGFLLICRTCKIAYDMPSKDQLFAEVDQDKMSS